MGRLLLLACAVFIAQVSIPRTAYACDLASPDALSTSVFDLDSLRTPDPDQTLTVTGAYLVETVLTVEANDEWTRGSVNAITRTWGQAPASVRPFVHRTVERSSDECPAHGDGPELDDQEIRLMTNPETSAGWVSLEYASEEEAFAVLKELFGRPLGIQSDPDEEARLLGTLHNARPGSAVPVAIAFGIGLVVFGSVSYWKRHRQLLAQWATIKAESEAELARGQPTVEQQ